MANNRWIKKLWHIRIAEYCSAFRGKEILPFAASWVDLLDTMLSKISQLQKDEYYMIPLYEVSKVVKLTDAENMVVARGQRKGGNREVLNEYKVTVIQDE